MVRCSQAFGGWSMATARTAVWGIVPLLCMLAASTVSAADVLQFDFSEDPLLRFAEARRTEIVCPRSASLPVIDGNLDDDAWRQAAEFTLPRSSDAVPATTIRLCYGGDRIFLGITCSLRPEARPIGETGSRDAGGVWKGDHIEVWLDPTLESKTVYQFVHGAGDAIFDLCNGDTSYDPNWEHAVAHGDSHWTQEIAIPREAFGLDAWQREFGFNIGRNGPTLQPHAWVGKYGQTAEGLLVLDGITSMPPRQAQERDPVTESDDLAVDGEGLGVHLERGYARPGERFVEIGLSLAPASVPLAECRLDAALYLLTGSAPVAELSVVPARARGTLRVDLRTPRLDRARIAIELHGPDKRLAAASVYARAQPCAEPLRSGQRIEVKLDVPDGIAPDRVVPVTFGAPFAAGALWERAELRLVDVEGKGLPHQTETMAQWAPEGSIKWVRFDALVRPDARCFIERARTTAPSTPDPPLHVESAEGLITVDTGPSRFVLGKGASPLIAAYRNGTRLAAAEGVRGLYVIDQNDRLAVAAAADESVSIEAAGPVAACVRFEGWYQTESGERLARHITRVECFAGQPGAVVTHTLVLTGDTSETWFKEVGWELALTPGESPRALFGTARSDWRAAGTWPLDAEKTAVSMLQDQHQFFAHASNHFAVTAHSANGLRATLLEGEECGDWCALRHGQGGFAVACRDAARQHPKEFEVGRDRLTLRLFSNSAGEELDFRTATLIEKWDLENWYKSTHSVNRRDSDFIAKVTGIVSNAVGWTKTHELLFLPLAPDSSAAEPVAAARLHAEPVYGLVDPWAAYRSKAMGPLYPSVPERFPLIEKAVMGAFRHFVQRDSAWGEHGFVDYFSGPHLVYGVYDQGTYVGMKRYCYSTYTLRSDLWLVYARTGARAVRAFAAGTNRTFMDANYAHWDGPDTVKGLHRTMSGLGNDLPFYWGNTSSFEISSSSNHDNIALFYYLTGYRRARDCMLEYVDGVKRAWTPLKAAHTWRPLMLFRLLTQAYAFTHDPVLKTMAVETFSRFADADTALGLSKEFRPYQSTTYKTNVDNRALLEAWNVFGEERYRQVAHRLAQYWWQLLGTDPIIYTNPQPRVGHFLFAETHRPVYPELLALQLRRAARTYDPVSAAIRPQTRLAAHNVAFYFEGVPYALDVVTRAGAERERLTSWIGYDDVGYDTSVIVRKDASDVLELQASIDAGDIRGQALGGITVEPVAVKTLAGLNLVSISEAAMDFQGYHHGSARISIPKDAPAGEYEVRFPRAGLHFVIADSRAPMVLHAPDYWQPTLLQTPPARYYFELPEGSTDAQVFFERDARLFTPDDTPAFDGEPQQGWVDLPADTPGVWAFEAVDGGLVRVRNLPPFFATAARGNYFTPTGKSWQHEDVERAAPAPPADQLFGAGAVQQPDDQSLCLTGSRVFHVEPGAPHPSGDGTLFLPFRQGTIEFWLKPLWSSVDLMTPELRAGTVTSQTKRFVLARMDTSGKGSGLYQLNYVVWPTSKDLTTGLLSDGSDGLKSLRSFRYNTILERDEWVHIAWVWGQLDSVATHRGAVGNILVSRVYVNGKAGKQHCYKYPGNLPLAPMTAFQLGSPSATGNMDAYVDELRISGTQRYATDFVPPSREVELRCDEHTRALFHFDGDLAGESSGHQGDVPATLTP